MSIQWLCTGKSEHAYDYKDSEGYINTSSVIAIDFKADVYTPEDINELYNTKPVLTQAGVEAFVGLQVYPQGFTVYFDDRLTDRNATDVIEIADDLINVSVFSDVGVGEYLSVGSDDV